MKCGWIGWIWWRFTFTPDQTQDWNISCVFRRTRHADPQGFWWSRMWFRSNCLQQRSRSVFGHVSGWNLYVYKTRRRREENKWRFGVCQSYRDGRETQIKSLRISFTSSICVNTRVWASVDARGAPSRWNPDARLMWRSILSSSGSHMEARRSRLWRASTARFLPRGKNKWSLYSGPLVCFDRLGLNRDSLGFHKQFIKEIFFLLRITWATVKVHSSKFPEHGSGSAGNASCGIWHGSTNLFQMTKRDTDLWNNNLNQIELI